MSFGFPQRLGGGHVITGNNKESHPTQDEDIVLKQDTDEFSLDPTVEQVISQQNQPNHFSSPDQFGSTSKREEPIATGEITPSIDDENIAIGNEKSIQNFNTQATHENRGGLEKYLTTVKAVPSSGKRASKSLGSKKPISQMTKVKKPSILSSARHLKSHRSETKNEVSNSRNFQAQTTLPRNSKGGGSLKMKQFSVNLKHTTSAQPINHSAASLQKQISNRVQMKNSGATTGKKFESAKTTT
mmetsp:Transcript_42242/g.64757  ORF Transcript_42242/g.64757 Transcript_42242/m.64757 type:complete len:243 (-) Transcript_42242:1261-1989(-)|eukprot:CAMPEP_0170485576 /NCGR_PEP_ID=MMETSP0208-20121228/4818_1 /TAXON_ID=197538 /ORGANISM="Strombidium inclinatum, Strain S3" /LENGTH=242 /DNA_ID=CAMNT_0010759271 /DNA_START=2309 /DNA_END=3037 /DNA_ORIENTATION=-